MKVELDRRQSATDQVLALFCAHPLQWLHWRRFEKFSACAWRSRIADARRIVQREDGDIVWNKRVKRSAYMFVPQRPLGRDAGEQVSQKSLF